MKLKIPNILTIGRIILVPIFIGTFYLPGAMGDWIPFFIFILASFTDFLDGLLARLYKEESKLGELLDPVADNYLSTATLNIQLICNYVECLDPTAENYICNGDTSYLCLDTDGDSINDDCGVDGLCQGDEGYPENCSNYNDKDECENNGCFYISDNCQSADYGESDGISNDGCEYIDSSNYICTINNDSFSIEPNTLIPADWRGELFQIDVALNQNYMESFEDIFIDNSENILKVLNSFSENLEEIKKAIQSKSGEKLNNIFSSTRKLRKEIIKAGQETDKPNFGRK